MLLSVLLDNSTLIDRYLRAEPGLSLLIKDQDHTILFDCGYSGLFLDNARRMRLSLAQLDYVVLSHGHLDHTWGLTELIRDFTEEALAGRPCNRPQLVAHPAALTSVQDPPCQEIGSMLPAAALSRHLDLQLSDRPLQLSSNLLFLGQIERLHAFEDSPGVGIKEGESTFDTLPDDSALAYAGPDGLVIITGCAHSGICNIVDQAKRLTGESRIADIIGGLHLLDPNPTRLEGTIRHLRRVRPAMLSPCHCTDLRSKIALSRIAPLRNVGVGLQICYA